MCVCAIHNSKCMHERARVCVTMSDDDDDDVIQVKATAIDETDYLAKVQNIVSTPNWFSVDSAQNFEAHVMLRYDTCFVQYFVADILFSEVAVAINALCHSRTAEHWTGTAKS